MVNLESNHFFSVLILSFIFYDNVYKTNTLHVFCCVAVDVHVVSGPVQLLRDGGTD